ncbi:MAG: PD-(D/E)XK nuclease family protein, partial [Candidatus Saccharibacteria bacterium]|nr:PD-(D/E)XK nuclease family protein [Candidatus Saccharibacteria bacterium]
DDAHLSGKIDQLIINKIDKTIVVVDFKTGSSYSRWTNETKLHKYKQQLYFYKLLVENSHTYAGYKVVDAYLQFVEPNDNNEIIELHLNFNESELDHTRRLISKIWQHIMDLDFPDTTNYDDSYKGMIQLETDLIDGII